MCGIAGCAATAAWRDRPDLEAMRDTLRHRGPDDAGVWWSEDGRVGLAHRRLAILDPSPAGHQPMATDDGRLVLTFNGEIYNFRELRAGLEARGHRFTSSGDTEVLLAAYRVWGPACVARLRGMFAFALYDRAGGQVVLARDRAGEKPLFYRHEGDRLWFASELKALLAHRALPRVLDATALDAYLAFGYVPGDACLLEGFRKLEAGTIAVYDLATGRLDRSRYWSLPAPPDGAAAAIDPLLEELDALLEGAVREQLVADVPVGVLLSGGIDSSLVVAMASRVAGTRVRTFTITFPGHGAFDEGPHARLVARHFGTEHHELEAEPATLDLVPALVRQYDEPIADSSMLPTHLVSRLIRPHCTVALGGDGGDELFGGYRLYQVVLGQQRLRARLPALVRGPLSAAAGRLPVGFRGRTYARALALDPLDAVAETGLYFDRPTRLALCPLLRVAGRPGAGEAYRRAAAAGACDTVQQLTRADFASYLCDDILVKVDRASMLASLEVRAPFLDPRVIEFAFGRVPGVLRATLFQRKVLTRRLAARLLPPALDLSRKQGFSIPLARWFRGEWGRFLESVLAGTPAELLDAGMVRRLVDGQRRGLNNGQRLFALAMLELWRREYGAEIPQPGRAVAG